jgi:hypothetical protein
MIIVLIIITIIIGMLAIYKADFDEDTVFVIFGLLLLALIIVLLVCKGVIINGSVIDQKIDLMQSQNEDIENKIELSVKQYMNYEKDTYKDLKTDSYIQLVNLYPELKSDTLIQQQMTLYQKNNDDITKLKMDKIDISIYKWWVYFGK